MVAADDFWSHPLVRPDLACHVILQPLGPSEICELDLPAVVEQQVEAFEIAVQHGHWPLMQVIHGQGSAERQLPAVFPAELFLPLQQRPQRSPFAVLKHYGEVRRLGTSTQEHDDIWMAKGLHRVALAHEVPDCVLVVLLYLEDLDCDCAASPRSLVNYTVSSL